MVSCVYKIKKNLWKLLVAKEMNYPSTSPPLFLPAQSFIWLWGERWCSVIYTLPAKRGLGHDCHLKAFTRKPRRVASSCAQPWLDLPVVFSRRSFFLSQYRKTVGFFSEGRAIKCDLNQAGSLYHWDAVDQFYSVQQCPQFACYPIKTLWGCGLLLSLGNHCGKTKCKQAGCMHVKLCLA